MRNANVESTTRTRLVIRYGPSAKNPSANDATTGGSVGTRGWSLAPGSSSAAYTAGTTPRELNSASKMGFAAPLNGDVTSDVTSSASNAAVPDGATVVATPPRASQPSASAARPGTLISSSSEEEEEEEEEDARVAAGSR